jgi:imidazole glycerol-phosphate synthase subunit HisH
LGTDVPAGVSISVIDYGMGNLRSVVNALDFLGVSHVMARTPAEVLSSERLLLPGVGSFRRAIENLNGSGVADAIKAATEGGTPILGICLGMHLLADYGDEGGGTYGLGLLRGRVVKLPSQKGLRIPHMGFNEVAIVAKHPLLAGIEDQSHFYFAHSYQFSDNEDDVVARASYGTSFAAVMASGRVAGAQFHPEKSQSHGLRMLRNFCKLSC